MQLALLFAINLATFVKCGAKKALADVISGFPLPPHNPYVSACSTDEAS